MRRLSKQQVDLVEEVLVQKNLPILPSLLEKDILVRDAVLAVKDVGKNEGCKVGLLRWNIA